MRRVFLAAVALVVALSCAATARPAATFAIRGHGWGHGLGLAQYGAYGYARDDGRNFQWIIDHYYPGTTLGAAGVGRVKVLLTEGVGQVSIGSSAGYSVTDANGHTYNLTGAHVLRPNLRIVSANGQTRTLVGPVRFNPGGSPLRVSGTSYRGLLRVRNEGGRLSVVNDLGLEQYVKGVVAREMPSSWHPEALKAQAVVARTYALVSRKTGSWFSLYDDTRSQVYGGVRPRPRPRTRRSAGRPARSSARAAPSRGRSTTRRPAARRRPVWTSGGRPRSRTSSASPTRTTASRPTTTGAPPMPTTTAPTRVAIASGRRRRSSAPWAAGRRTR